MYRLHVDIPLGHDEDIAKQVAEQIVREFELHVKVGSTYYSPAYK